MDVKQKFVELTSKTYPHGTEHELVGMLPNYLKSDQFGNLYHEIGSNPTTMFTCHLDTASYDQKTVTHIINDNIITSDGTTILGADDKAGVVVLLYLMEKNIPGIYYFFLGEERGCIGSRKVSSIHSQTPLDNINKVVSFDRRGYDSVITHQLSGRSCSYDFAKNLSEKLNQISNNILKVPFSYKPDSTGIYTDSAQFTTIYSECTNISVGYHNEHTKNESQDIEHLDNLCKVVSLIDWDKLPTFRDIKKVSQDFYDSDDYYDYHPRTFSHDWDYAFKKEDTKIHTITILDEKYFGFESVIKYQENLELTHVKLHTDRCKEEKERIVKLLNSLEVDYDKITWDGNVAIITQDTFQTISLKRKEIKEYLSDIDDWIETEIKYRVKNYI